jgi:hypothetical protein
METEGSLPYSQEPSTGPYSEPDRFKSYIKQFIYICVCNFRLDCVTVKVLILIAYSFSGPM